MMRSASTSRSHLITAFALPGRSSRALARAMGGTLTVEDSETGARFVVRIPVRER
ncbi:hypothetical protein [Nonomuraea sp. NPDC002799]